MSNEVSSVGVPVAVAYVVQFLTNFIRRSPLPTPRYLLPVIAVTLGIALSTLYGVMEGTEFNKPSMAKFLIQGLLAGGGAVLGTEMHKQARAEQPVIVDVPVGVTVAVVEHEGK